MQKIQIIGNIGGDAEIKDLNGVKYISFSVGCNKSYKDKEGVKNTVTSWYGILIKKGEGDLVKYLLKGTQVYIDGELTVNVFKSKEGVHKAGLNVFVQTIQLLGGKKDEKEDTSENKEEIVNDGLPPNDPF